jgi:hypothetical protein
MIWFLAILGFLGLTGFIARCAGDRGRSPAAWAALSTVAAVAAFIAGIFILGRSIATGPTDLSLGTWALGLFAFVLGPLAAMLAVLGCLVRLPDVIPTVRGDRWTVYRMSTRNDAGGDCQLSVEADGVHIGDVVAPIADIGEIAVDGEYLRVSWAAGSALLMPKDAPTPRARTRRSLALKKRLGTLVRAARAPRRSA